VIDRWYDPITYYQLTITIRRIIVTMIKITAKKIIIAVAIMAVGLGSAFVGCKRESGARIVIKGSTTVLPITQKAMEAYRQNHNVSITIEGSGSGNGIKAILDGSTDIANASRQMKPKELAAAQQKNIAIEEIVCAYDMIVPVIHPSNPVTNLTTAQLKGIYEGTITNWKQVGGQDSEIVVISRDTSSGTYEYWYEEVMKKKDVRQDSLLQASNGAVVSAVAGNAKAIGYIGFGYLNDTVKALNVNGVQATIENGKSRTYPISRGLYMYVNKTTLSQEARDFINFILGPEGQKIVKEAGYIPL